MKSKATARIRVITNGPYLVEGGLKLAYQHIVTNEQGESLDWREGDTVPSEPTFRLCRCGRSGNKPFCDNTHSKSHFDGTETATREHFELQAQQIDGPRMVLMDAEKLCAFARFCDPKGQIWNLVTQTDHLEARKLVEHESGHCPSGRLVAKDRTTGQPFEPLFEPSIGLVKDTAKGIGGPLWVRGGIPVIGSDGVAYETRNRVTLCRCGASKNKPFCDGSHASIGFDDTK